MSTLEAPAAELCETPEPWVVRPPVGRMGLEAPATDPLSVLVVTESFLPQVNGVTNSVCRVLEHLQARGHHTALVAPTGPDTYAGAEVRRVASVPLPVYDGFRLGTPRAATLRQLLRRHRPDVVHLASPTLMGPRAAREAWRLGIPTVGIYQTDLVGFASRYAVPGGRAAMERVVQRAHRHLDLVLAPSASAAAQLAALGLDMDRVRTWGRGVDLVRFHPDRRSAVWRERFGAPGRRVIGYMGRLAAEKEIALLGRVQDVPDSTLVIVGDGPARPGLERALPGAIFTGALHGAELAEAVASFDLFVHPGRHETFCQAVQEALACGVPAVVAGAGGPLDLVDPHENGAHFRPGDGADLVRVVSELLRWPRQLSEMGREARRSVQGRSWEAIGDQLVAHYRDAATATGAVR